MPTFTEAELVSQRQSGLQFDSSEQSISTNVAAVMALTTATIFTVLGGPIKILDLFSVAITVNNANAATLKYNFLGTVGTSTDISAASASLASLPAGDMAILAQTALSTAVPLITTTTSAMLGPAGGAVNIYTNGPGALRIIIGTAATTGTWQHYLRYKPMSRGVSVIPAF